MSESHRGFLALAFAACSAAFVPSVSAQPAARPDPLDAEARVPAASYRSAFEGYRRWTDQEVGDWRRLNETVGGIGGWRVYAREVQQGADEAAKAASASAAPSNAAPATPASSGTRPAAPAGAHKH